MKANAPEKLYYAPYGDIREDNPITDNDIEYVRKDAFIEKALKWYCLDCECNDNCKDTKCFFYREYERYLKGETNALPPKISGRILDEDGSTSDNWRYRHFTSKMQDAFIENACKFIRDRVDISFNVECSNGEPLADSYSEYALARLEAANKIIDEFKNYMKGESYVK